MKKLCTIFIGVLLSVDVAAVPVQVKYIVDGDTFISDVLLADDIKITSVGIRIRNVDTPEIHGMCEDEITHAEQAKQRLSELIPENSVVEIKNIKNDKYMGRIDAEVYDSLNRDIGSVLIREKLGRPYSGGKRKSWCN